MQGQILTAQERWDKADHSFDAAIVRLEELGSRLELGHALYQRSIMRAASGQLDAARADTRRAHGLFEECGAQGDVEKARGRF